VKREQLDFLADNTHFTKRFAFFVGRRCRHATIKDVAKELNLDWDAVKELDKQYMAAQLARAGAPGPKVIGIDEISIGKGQNYRIVVSDLLRRRPIWFGGTDRSEASMSMFYDWLGPKKSQGIPSGGDGHVEAVPHCGGQEGAESRDFIRQVSYHEAPG
jgi:transposase